MKKKETDLTRRNFLAKGGGAAAAAVSSIIVIENLAAPNMKAAGIDPAVQPLPGDPVTTDAVQTLTNKTLPRGANILGTDYRNIREFTFTGNNIKQALDAAITALSTQGSLGGQILIPHGIWESEGGHELKDSISIEGVGFNLNPAQGSGYGTEIKMTPTTGDPQQNRFMFRMTTPLRNCSLKNMGIDLRLVGNATGLLMTNLPSGPQIIYCTSVENVGFYGGAYGIRVQSATGQFECILNRFVRVAFLGCFTSFYCNSINGGYTFDNCYFSLPYVPVIGDELDAPVALHCPTIGNLSMQHCLFVGNQPSLPNQPPNDNSTILRTLGEFNNICFNDCQDENIHFYYQNGTNYFAQVPVVLKNCVVQSKFKYTASGSLVFESCRINVTNGGAQIIDSLTAHAQVYLKGVCNVFWQLFPPAVTRLDNFVNANSMLIYDAEAVGSQRTVIPSESEGPYHIHATSGIVNIPKGETSVTVYNNLVADSLPNFASMVFAVLRHPDQGDAMIKNVTCFPGAFEIVLDRPASQALSVGFHVVR